MQRAAGVIAARHRGDLAGAEALLASFDTDQARTLGFYLLAALALGLVRAQTGQSWTTWSGNSPCSSPPHHRPRPVEGMPTPLTAGERPASEVNLLSRRKPAIGR